jgi:hypothetical protein
MAKGSPSTPRLLPLALSLLLPACGSPPPRQALDPFPRLPAPRAPAARVLRVEEGRPLRGPLLAGRAGDFLLENGLVAVVVQGLDGEHPGALVEAARGDRREDALRFLAPSLGTEALRPPVLERVRAEELGGAATLELVGREAEDPELEVMLEYSLGPGQRALQIVTRVRNRSTQRRAQLELGDLLDLGAADPFAPGAGSGPLAGALPASQPASAAVALEWPWLGAWTEAVSYLYRAHRGPLRIRTAREGLVSTLATVDLAPGASASTCRWLAVGDGGGLQGLELPSAGSPRGRLEVSVVDEEPLAGAQVVVRRGHALHAIGRADRDGAAGFVLEPGRYTLRAIGDGREGRERIVEIEAGRSSAIRLEAGPPSSLVHDLRDERGEPLPVTLALSREGPPPWRGARAAEPGEPARTLLVPRGGRGTAALPPGRFRVSADAGPLRTIHTEELTLAPRVGASVAARLRRVAAPALFALDLGQRSVGTPGCSAPIAERLAASLAAGLDGIVPAEGERLSRWLAERPRLLVAGADALAGLELLRVIDHEPARSEERLARWLAELQAGRRPVAVGGSSACALARPGGFPRSYLDLEGARPTAAAIAAALRAGRVVASNGPLLALRVEGKGPGATVTARRQGRAREAVVAVQLQVSAPAWVALDELQLYLDGKAWGRALPIAGRVDGVRLERTLELPVARSGIVCAVLRGPRGGLAPVAPEARPLAVANPVRVELPR